MTLDNQGALDLPWRTWPELVTLTVASEERRWMFTAVRIGQRAHQIDDDGINAEDTVDIPIFAWTWRVEQRDH